MIRAIDHGYPQKEIADAAYRFTSSWTTAARRWWWRQQVRHARRQGPSTTCRIDEQVEVEQIERVFTPSRRPVMPPGSRRRLKQLADACRNGGNVMPVPHRRGEGLCEPRRFPTCTVRCWASNREPSSSDAADKRPICASLARRSSLRRTPRTPRSSLLAASHLGRFDRPPRRCAMVKGLDRSWSFETWAIGVRVAFRTCGHSENVLQRQPANCCECHRTRTRC